MITPSQQKWIDHLSDVDKIKISPFDPKSSLKFEEIKKQIRSVLGENLEVLHRGASALEISGQSEIDVYIPVPVDMMDQMTVKMEKVFGKPKSIYPEERTKFIKFIDKTKLEIMITNQSCQSWIDGEFFYKYLNEHKDALEEYRGLKEGGNGMSVREYYRRKIEFINEILKKT